MQLEPIPATLPPGLHRLQILRTICSNLCSFGAFCNKNVGVTRSNYKSMKSIGSPQSCWKQCISSPDFSYYHLASLIMFSEKSIPQTLPDVYARQIRVQKPSPQARSITSSLERSPTNFKKDGVSMNLLQGTSLFFLYCSAIEAQVSSTSCSLNSSGLIRLSS